MTTIVALRQTRSDAAVARAYLATFASASQATK
jgi:hypothetical protein